MHAIKHRIFFRDEVVSLSEQQLIDCDYLPNLACKGGEALYAYRYVQKNGLALSEDYPYRNKYRGCSYDKETMLAVTIKDFKVFQRINNEDLKVLVCHGAVSVPFYINDCIKNYSHGVITDFHGECGCTAPESFNHAVTIVGFG